MTSLHRYTIFTYTGTYANDIALVQLKETIPLSLSDRVGLIDLSVSSDSVDPETCSVYGWGCAAVGSAVQSTIQKGNLPLVSDDRCQSIWHVNMEKRVCAGGSSTMSACHVSYRHICMNTLV